MLRTLFATFFFLIFCSQTDARAIRKEYRSCIYNLPLPVLPQGEVSYINGMNHKPERALMCAETIADMAGGYNIYTIYNPTKGFLGDIAKCFAELYHYKVTPPAQRLHEKWNLFFETHGPDEKLLQFCHSEGAIQVRNALLRYPPHLRNRIIVVAIAPAAYISDLICCEAFHYASRRDIVPKLDKRGRARCKEKTLVLTPHPEAAFFDHHFLSPTFRPAIEFHLADFLKNHCHVRLPPNESNHD